MADPLWKQQLLPASFRGVPFFYSNAGGTFGRKTVVKELPEQDLPIVEDQGRLSRKFTFDMFVLGENYMAARDDMIEALEKAGPGELVHPYLGTIKVTLIGEANMTETTREGGMARFNCTFMQTGIGSLVQHFDPQDQVSAVRSAISRARSAVSAAFQSVFSTVNAVSSSVTSAVNSINDVVSLFSSVRGKIASSLLVVDSAADAISDLSDNAAALVRTPSDLAGTMLDLPTTICEGISKVVDSAAYVDAISFYTNEDSLPNEGSVISARTQVDALTDAIAGFLDIDAIFVPIEAIASQQLTLETTNQNALERLTKASCIFAAADTVLSLDFESYDQAQAMFTSMSGLIDDLMTDDNLEDEVYGPLADLRAQLASYLSNVAKSLPELQTFTPIQTIPALVLAYQLYGDAAFESDILARNTQIIDPTAVRGGQPLRVLFNG